VRKLLLIGVIALTGCASLTSMQSAPPELEAIHQATRARITYQNYAKKDWRYIPKDQKASGNCAVYTLTNFTDAAKAGYSPQIRLCRTSRGVAHAYTQVGDWALDNRFRWVIPMSQQDCK